MTKNRISAILLIILAISWSLHVYANESSIYNFSWLDPEKEVYVLQNRKFRKKRRVFISGSFGRGLSGVFTSSTQFQGRAGFFFKEDYGISFLYSKNNSKKNSGAIDSLYTGNNPFLRLIDSYRGALFLWSPFYSKGNFFNQVFYYDFIVGLGYVELSEITNRDTINDIEGEANTNASHMGPLIDLEIKFFVNRSFNININATSVHYKDKNIDGYKEYWYNNWDLSIGLGIIL